MAKKITTPPPTKDSLLEQLAQAQKMLDGIKASQSPAPTGQVLGASTMSPEMSDAMKYGAAGRGEFPISDEDAAKIKAATEAGVPMSELGSPTGNKKNPKETYLDAPQKFKQPALSSGDVTRYIKSYGLDGMVNPNMYAGKTASEVDRLLLREKAKRRGQVSANTSSVFNPETLKKTQRAVDKFNFALDEADKDPFEPKKFKEDTKKNIIEVTGKELGKLFSSSEEIYSAYQTNPQLRATLDNYIKKGGSIEGIAKNVTAPVVQTFDQAGQNTQDPATYLANLRNPQANQKAQDMAIDELSPETDIAQAEIMRQAKVPDELKTLYFGDEKSIGVLQMKREQAVEEKRILEEKEKDAKRSARDKAQLQIERNKADVKIEEAKIEENRLAAKNYMTARLASLGALQTTGAAVLALQTIETKYQSQVSNLRTKLKFANREIELGLSESIDKIENDTDDNILKIQEDLTKDSETIAKEVLKAQNDAEKEIYRVTEQHARRLRERTTQYTKDLKAAAEKQAKEYAKIASGGIDFTSVGNVAKGSKIVNTIENILEGSRGSDGYVNSAEYSKQLKEWIKKGGTARTFVAAFPPKLYANPEDTSLPPTLRYARESQTVKVDENDIEAEIDRWVEENQ
jgi:hypothetical protein